MGVRQGMLGIVAVAAATLSTATPGTAQDDGDLRTEAPPAYQLDARRLRAVFLDLLGRPPFRDEREKWRGRGMVEFLDEVLDTNEVWNNWLEEQFYYFLLVDNFRPTSDRVLAIPADLGAARLGVRDALHRIVISASFDRRNPGPDTFVTVVMEQLLGVVVQKDPRELEVGKRIYDGGTGVFLGKSGNSQSDVVRISIEDRRTLEQLIEREYGRLVRREPTRREVKRWALTLQQSPKSYPKLLRGWLLSDAYTQRLESRAAQPNRMFVRSLFIDLVDRLPDEAETRRMRNALDGLADARPLRSVLARLLLDSGTAPIPGRDQIEDPTAWVAGLVENLLGREATREELAVFVTSFHDPACRPSTVVYALVSHPEYQTW